MANAARYCAIISGVLQLLLALVGLWILIDLNVNGTPITSFALILDACFVVAQICILGLAWQLSVDSLWRLWPLVAIYSFGLALLAIFLLFGLSIDFESWILRPGAVLPPNEIMGRHWPLALAEMSAGAALLIGILPLVSLSAVLLWGSRVKPPAASSSGQRS